MRIVRTLFNTFTTFGLSWFRSIGDRRARVALAHTQTHAQRQRRWRRRRTTCGCGVVGTIHMRIRGDIPLALTGIPSKLRALFSRQCLTIRMSNSPHIYSTLCRAHFIQIVKTPIYFNLRYTRRYFFFFNAILINGSVYTSNAINFGTGTHSAGVFVCTYSRYVQRDIIKWEGNLYM